MIDALVLGTVEMRRMGKLVRMYAENPSPAAVDGSLGN